MILISACLAGINCKYNGENNGNEKVMELIKNEKTILVCPEQLGGLKTPRIPAEIKIINGEKRVITKDGIDVTLEYTRGANEVLELAKRFNITKAILKSKSPSCGCGQIYDGNFSNNLIIGNGITADLLIKNGIEVITEKDL